MQESSSNNGSGLKSITSDARRYVEKRLELLALVLSEKVSGILAEAIQRMTGILLLAAGLFFAWFAVGFLLADLVENLALGFFLSSLPLLLAAVLFMKQKPAIFTRKIQESIVQNVLESLDSKLEEDDMDEERLKVEKKEE